jgi:aerobic carbon-monoxide dehydrogenase medium subunit
MIPEKFEYARASSAEEAVRLLTEGGEDAKVLSGGQSLIPLLRLRLAAPTMLVDVGSVEEMREVRDEGDTISVGAAATLADVLRSPLIAANASLVIDAGKQVADRQVRHRGTFGGALAHADPAGDLPAVALALGATMEVAGPGGRREIPVSEFFVDYLTTAVGPDEVLVSVKLPKRPGWGTHYEKFNRTAQSWALVGVAAAVRREDGSIAEARVALTNMGATPVRAVGVEAALTGGSADDIASAASHAAEGTRPASDLTASGEYRKHLVTVLTRRAVMAAAGM